MKISLNNSISKLGSVYSNITTKMNKIRKQNWSAPAIMTVFLLFCMLLIYGLENIGLMNKERNLLYRHVSPELKIRQASKHKVLVDHVLRFSNTVVKSREEYVDVLMHILLNGAESQYNYLIREATCGDAGVNSIHCDSKEFYDI
jgi:hypothetical protein